MRILVLEQCSSTKNRLSKKRPIPARELYISPRIQLTKQTIDRFRNKFLKKGVRIDFYIHSAKYGVINENKRLTYYDFTFATLNNDEIIKYSREHKIHDTFLKVLRENKYEYVFLLTPYKYLIALGFNDDNISKLYVDQFKETKFILFIPKNNLSLLHKNVVHAPNFYFFDIFNNKCLDKFGSAIINIRSVFFSHMLIYAYKTNNFNFEDVINKLISEKCG